MWGVKELLLILSIQMNLKTSKKKKKKACRFLSAAEVSDILQQLLAFNCHAKQQVDVCPWVFEIKSPAVLSAVCINKRRLVYTRQTSTATLGWFLFMQRRAALTILSNTTTQPPTPADPGVSIYVCAYEWGVYLVLVVEGRTADGRAAPVMSAFWGRTMHLSELLLKEGKGIWVHGQLAGSVPRTRPSPSVSTHRHTLCN